MLRNIHLRVITKNERLLSRFYGQKESKNYSRIVCYEKVQSHNQAQKAGRLLLSVRNSQRLITASRAASTYLEKNYSKSIIEDASLDFAGLARKYKYPVEAHNVTTTDGYILQIYRLPRPQGKPVFLMHGLLDSSDTWIIPGTDIGLGYYLYDLGYDVWLGNARGNFYSRKHIKASPEEKSFWDFSWHEIGYYDLPAMIDYVLDKTCQQQLSYFGHSQGTTVFFVMASTRPEYNSKIRLMNALAPVAYMNYASAPLEFIMRRIINFIEAAAFEIVPRTDVWKIIFSSKATEMFYVKYMLTYLGAYKDMWPAGTTVFFVMASTRPEYNSKIRLMNALAPVAYMNYASAPLEFIMRRIINFIEAAAFEIVPRTDAWKIIFSSKATEMFYVKYMLTYLGAYKDMWPADRIPAIAAHAASGCSFKQVKHYAQVKEWQRFCLYDYGEKENLKRYGSKEPPSYRLENITAPIALYYAQNDPLSNVKDVQTLIAQLPNVVEDHMYPDKQWNHVSMIWGVNAREMAHKRIVEVLGEHHCAVAS